MKTPAVSVQHLSVQFNGTQRLCAVQDVSFEIAAGKTLALIGQSGSGKSVTSLALMGLLPAHAEVTGVVRLQGNDNLLQLESNAWQAVRGNDISMVFQEPMSALNPVRTAGDQLIENILTHQSISKAEANQQAISWFEKVKLPQPAVLLDRYPHQLSGGQKQRVMIAMAMCNHPKLLIADEPTTALDVTVQQEVTELMKQLQEEFGTAMLFITHDLRLAEKVADDFIVMEKGKLVKEKLHPKIWLRSRVAIKNEETLLRVENVKVYFTGRNSIFSKKHDDFKAVDDVSFEIKKGEILGLVGESGCGKSTLSKTILGLQPSTAGNIYFKGKNITALSPGEWRRLRNDIQIIFQDPYSSLNPRIKAGDAIAEVIRHSKKKRGEELRKRVNYLLEKVQLPLNSYHKYPHEFSGGQRQRICIARALAMQPALVICDESVAALDVNTQEQVLKLLKDLQQQDELTYLFITHDLKIVNAISDRTLVMEKGKIVEYGDTDKVMNQPQNEYTKRLLEAAL